MDVFEQEFLKPGKFEVAPGVRVTLTQGDIKNYVDGTREMIAAGYLPPVLFEHSAAGSADGSPRDRKASEVKHGSGWLKDVRINEQGGAVHVLEVNDSAAAEKLRNGSIKFTSPELRPSFRDGSGREFRNVISHVALTHKPRFIKQGPITPIQLSLDEAGPSLGGQPIQLSLEDYVDDEDKKPDSEAEATPPEATEAEPENKDIPAKDSEAEMQLQAVLAQLKDVAAIDLPADTTMETLVPYLLTALKTKAAHEAKAEADDATENDDSGVTGVTEEKPPLMQFSLDDALSGKLGSKLLAKVITQSHAGLMSRLDKLVDDARITPGLRDKLGRREAMQFSADADELPGLTLGNVLDLLEEHTVPGQAWDASITSQFSAEEPEITGEMTPEQAKKIVDQQAKHLSILRA